MRIGAPLAVLLLVATVVAAGVRVDQTVTTSPAAKAPPVTLAAGSAGSTTLGSSATSATTTGVTLPVLGTAQALKLQPGAASYDARLEYVSVSGTGVLDSVTLALSSGTPAPQVIVTLGSVTQTIGSAVTIPGGGSDVQLLASGSCLGTCTFTLRILLVPTGATVPVLSYSYSLAVT